MDPMPPDPTPADPSPADPRSLPKTFGGEALRLGYLALGSVCVALGFIGYVTPVMPGTVFFIVALWAFKRSSPRLETWLLTRSPVASVLRDWDRDRSMRFRTKILAIGMIWLAILASVAGLVRKREGEWRAVLAGASPASTHPYLLLPPFLLLVAVSLTLYIATRKTKIVELEPPTLT